MKRTESIDVEHFIDANGLSAFHVVVMVLCFLVVLIEGVGQFYAIASVAACVKFVVGFVRTGSNSSVHGLGALLYPTSMRATGLGCVLALGRIGAIFSTLAGSFVLSAGRSYEFIFKAIATPAFVAAVGMGAMYVGTRLLTVKAGRVAWRASGGDEPATGSR